MIEMTLADMFLLTWAVIATAFALRYHEQNKVQAGFWNALMKDKPAREKFFKMLDEKPEEA
jgi:hypothetical protein